MSEKWIKIADLDGNGTISFDEFKEFFSKLLGEEDAKEESMKEVFDNIDENKNGQLDASEFTKAILATLNKT